MDVHLSLVGGFNPVDTKECSQRGVEMKLERITGNSILVYAISITTSYLELVQFAAWLPFDITCIHTEERARLQVCQTLSMDLFNVLENLSR
jgi:hypothetical protein